MLLSPWDNAFRSDIHILSITCTTLPQGFTSLSPQYIWCSVSDIGPVWKDSGWRWIKHGRFICRLLEFVFLYLWQWWECILNVSVDGQDKYLKGSFWQYKQSMIYLIFLQSSIVVQKLIITHQWAVNTHTHTCSHIHCLAISVWIHSWKDYNKQQFYEMWL